jgi:ATP-dependent protease HslVU (ClpYQ) ATPase subunit
MPTISFGAGGVLGFQGFDRFMQSMTGGGRRERRRLPVGEARSLLEEGMVETLFPAELIAKEALRVTQEEGIVFIDEIDKIVQPSNSLRHGEADGGFWVGASW